MEMIDVSASIERGMRIYWQVFDWCYSFIETEKDVEPAMSLYMQIFWAIFGLLFLAFFFKYVLGPC